MPAQFLSFLLLAVLLYGCAARTPRPIVYVPPVKPCVVLEESLFARDVKICEDEREFVAEVIFYNGTVQAGKEIARASNIILRPKEKDLDRYRYRGLIIVAVRIGDGYCLGEQGKLPGIETYSDSQGNEAGLIISIEGRCGPVRFPNPWPVKDGKQAQSPVPMKIGTGSSFSCA